MLRRNFLAVLGGLPFLGWLRPVKDKTPIPFQPMRTLQINFWLEICSAEQEGKDLAAVDISGWPRDTVHEVVDNFNRMPEYDSAVDATNPGLAWIWMLPRELPC